jgi:divalent metal cation (Fe/Co/Zn/Cd) transporter
MHLQKEGKKIIVDFHLANVSLKQAHAISERIEKQLGAADLRMGNIVVEAVLLAYLLKNKAPASE